MTEFMMMFRMQSPEKAPTQQEIEASMQAWNNWIGGIAAQGKLSGGSQLAAPGKVVRPSGLITDGPYAEIKEQLGGYLVVKADTLDEAATLAHGCPVFQTGGNVEIREVIPMR